MSEKTLTIVGSALAALLVIVGFKTFLEMGSGGHGEEKTTAGYQLPDPTAEPKSADTAAAPGGASVPAAASGEGDIATKAVAMIASADASKGAKLFRRCAACHSVKAGDPPALGPNLHGIVGRDVASQAAFSGYSDAMKAVEGNWSLELLAKFINNPKGTVPGTRMVFGGIKKENELADLLAYLQTQSN